MLSVLTTNTRHKNDIVSDIQTALTCKAYKHVFLVTTLKTFSRRFWVFFFLFYHKKYVFFG